MDDGSGWLISFFLTLTCAFCLLIAALGANVVRGALRARKHGRWVTGTVVEVREIYDVGETSGQRYSYQPIFEFDAPDGTRLRGEAGSYGHTNRHAVGSQCDILVDFDNPDIVFMTGWYRLAIGAFMVLLGLGCAGALLFAGAFGLGG